VFLVFLGFLGFWRFKRAPVQLADVGVAPPVPLSADELVPPQANAPLGTQVARHPAAAAAAFAAAAARNPPHRVEPRPTPADVIPVDQEIKSTNFFNFN
jgi:hypothetical protein